MSEYNSIGPKVLESKTLRWIVSGISLGITIGGAGTFIKSTYVTEKRASEIVGPAKDLAEDDKVKIEQLKKAFEKEQDENRKFHHQLVLGLLRTRAKEKNRKIDVSQMIGKFDANIRNGQTEEQALESLLLELE